MRHPKFSHLISFPKTTSTYTSSRERPNISGYFLRVDEVTNKQHSDYVWRSSRYLHACRLHITVYPISQNRLVEKIDVDAHMIKYKYSSDGSREPPLAFSSEHLVKYLCFCRQGRS